MKQWNKWPAIIMVVLGVIFWVAFLNMGARSAGPNDVCGYACSSGG